MQAFLLVSYCNLVEHLTATSRSLGGVMALKLAALSHRAIDPARPDGDGAGPREGSSARAYGTPLIAVPFHGPEGVIRNARRRYGRWRVPPYTVCRWE